MESEIKSLNHLSDYWFLLHLRINNSVMQKHVYNNPYVRKEQQESIAGDIERQNVISVIPANQKKPAKVIKKSMLPKALKAAIDKLSLSNVMKGKAFKLCSILYYKAFQDDNQVEDHIGISSSYLEKVFGKDYHKDFFNLLKSSGIIDCDERYRQGSKAYPGISKRYRIGTNFLSDDYTEVTYKEKSGGLSEDDIYVNPSYEYADHKEIGESDTTILTEARNSNQLPSSDLPDSNSSIHSNSSHLSISSYLHISSRFFEKQLLFDDLSSLVYDFDAMLKAIETAVLNISPRFLRTGDEILENHFEVTNRITGWSGYMKKVDAVEWCKVHEYTLIVDNGKYSIDDGDAYVHRKKRNLLLNYKWQLAKLENRQFYALRNKTNFRLDHNLTAISKVLLQIIKDVNDLVEIDIRNSQFAIHAFWLRQKMLWHMHEDVRKYYRICSTGVLYDELAKILSIERGEAKDLMMQLAFSKQGSCGELKNRFKEIFPNVLAHIEDFKRKKKDSRLFSIELQELEAEIMIDNLYPNIKKQGLLCLTKHDSLIVRRVDIQRVLEIMTDYFTHLDFECTVSVEGISQFIGKEDVCVDEIPGWVYELDAKQEKQRQEKEVLRSIYGNRFV